MHEKIFQVDFSYHCQQIFYKTTITKLRCISNTINIKTNNETASSLIIKKLNETQNTFTSMYIKYYIAWQISTKLKYEETCS